MKKFLKGLRYFLCYIAITLATAAGVVVYQSNNAGSINTNGNTTGSTVNQVENNLMEVVTNIMGLESFNVNSNISIKNANSQNQSPINIAFDIDINLGAGFSSIVADGTFDVIIANETYNINIMFVDNTFFVSALDKNVKFTANGIMEGAMGALALLDVKLPIDTGMFENFDVTSLLGYMGEYKEVETETGYNISLEFMGYDIAMVCDNEFNLNSVTIEDMLVEGFEIDLNLCLETYEQTTPISKPTHTFINLDTITSLVPMVRGAMESGHVSANIFASYGGYNLELNAKADFESKFLMQVTSPAFEGINFSFKDNNLFASVGNLKLKGNFDDINTIIDFVNNDLRTNLENISPDMVETITTKTNEITSSITDKLSNISLDKILEYIDYLTVTDKQIIIDIPEIATVVINIEDNTISNITISALGANLEINNISFEKEDISIDTNNFVSFEDVFPTLKTFVNTVFTKGISGVMSFSDGKNTNSLNYGIRYTNHFETSFDTTILDKVVSVVTDNSKVYLAIDGVKVNVDIAEYQQILDYINNTFDQNIALPTFTMPNLDIYEMVVGAISMVDYLKAIDGGIEMSIGGVVLKITSNESYLQNISIIYNNYTFSLDITGYGEVELFDIDKTEYLVFSDLTNYVDNALNFVQSNAYKATLVARTNIDSKKFYFGTKVHVSTSGNATAKAQVQYDDFVLDLNAILTDDALNINYDGLNIYGKLSAIDALKSLIENVVPHYVDLNKLLQDNGIDLDQMAATNIEIPAIDYTSLILALDNISLTQDTLSANLDLSKYDSNLPLSLNISLSMLESGYEAVITGYYNETYFSVLMYIDKRSDFKTELPQDAINVEDYLNLVEYVHNTIDSHNLALDITANVENTEVAAKALVDFRSGLKAQITSDSFGKPLTISYADNIDEVLISFANLNLSGKLSNVSDILNFVNGDLNNALVAYGVTSLEGIDTDVTNTQITFEDIKDILHLITFDDNKITFVKDNINVTLNIENKTITSINLVIDNIAVTITITDNNETFVVDNTGFVTFDSVFPTLETLIRTLTTKGISGNLSLSDGSQTLTLNYGLRYTNIFETSFDTAILGKTISVVTNASDIYLAIDGVKVTTDIASYTNIIDYINKTFGLNIALPELSTQDINIAELIVGAIDKIDYLKAINGGIEISVGGIIVTILSSDNYIENITVKYNGYTLALDVTGYGDIELFTINKDEYISFEDVTNYIDNTLTFIDSTSFDLNISAQTTIDGNDIAATINGKAGLNGHVIADINATYNNTNVAFGLMLTDNALNVNYDGLNIYGKLSAIDTLKSLIENVVPHYVDLEKLLQDNGITLDTTTQTKFEIPAIDYKKLVLAADYIKLTQNTLNIAIDFAKYDESLALYITLNIEMIENGYIVTINAVYDNMPITLNVMATTTKDFEATIPDNAINVEDYLNLVEYVHNTIDSRNLKLGVTANIDSYSIAADVLADFRDGLSLKVTTESLGSKLDIIYASEIEKLLVTFGNIKISGKYADLDAILNFVTGDLNNALMSYGVDTLANIDIDSLTNTSNDINVTFEDIKDILYPIKFNDNTISFVKDNINVAMTIANKTITNITLTIDNIFVSISVSDNTQDITYEEAGFSTFASVLENLKAVANVAASQAIGGKITITYNNDKTYTGNLKVSYINNVLNIHIDSNVYNQNIEIDIVGSVLYVKLNDLKLQVSWAERYSLQSYLNEKFGLNLDIDSIFDMAKSLTNANKEFSLKDINADFITKLSATANGLNLETNGFSAKVDIAEYKDTNKSYLSSISASFDKFDITINEMTFGQDAITEEVNAKEYFTYTSFTRYFDEIERLINASKDESTDQYTLSGNAKIYKLDTNGNALVVDGVRDEISITINELKFDATKNTFVGGVDATGTGSLYTEYLTGYDHSFDAAYDYNFIYFDYNGLRAKFSKQSNSEFITTLKKMVPTYLGDTALTRQLVEIFDMIRFDTMGNMLFNPIDIDVTYNMVESFAPMLSTLRLESDGSLTIGIDIAQLAPAFTEELLLNVSVDTNGKLALNVKKFKISKDLAIDFTIFVDTANTFTVNPTGTYMDMTSIGKLLGDFDNTAQATTVDNEVYKLNLSGSFHLKIKVTFINIDEDIPFKAQLVIDRNASQLIEAKIEIDMPSIILVTDGCYSTLYLTNRLEGENILYIDRQGKDPLKSKYKASELGSNLINVISDITAISASTLESFMSMDIKYIDGPTKAENVLKDYSCVTGVNSRDYTIGLDLRELTLMDMMLGYSVDNPTSIVLHSKYDKFTSIDISNITLEAISNVFIYLNGTIDLTDISQNFDIISEIEALDATAFGTWGDGSLVADFIENGGTNVPNKMGTTGRSFTLPVPVKEVVNSNTLEVYKFLGWSLNSDGSGELYNGKYMFGTTSLTFYAVWELDTVYTQRTISFVTEYLMANGIDTKVENNIAAITNYNGYDITSDLPQIAETTTIYYESEGVSITYRYEGLYKTKTINSDGTIVYSDKFEQTVMTDENITLYASFVEIDRVYKRKLAIYDDSKTLYEGYFVEGDDINILELVTYKDTTRWYDDYDATATTAAEKYTNEVMTADLPTTMPKGSDLTLYVRNKYTITYTSSFGDTKTYTQTDYQGENLNIPAQSSYEYIVYKEDGTTPNYLATHIYNDYYLSTDSTIVAPATISNKNATYSAKWDYVTTSYFKVTFNIDWTKPSWWITSGSEQSSNMRDAVATEYVLNGSTLNGTTLTKKNSIIGLTADTNVSKYSNCKYKYAINYNFETVGWSNSGVQNVYDDSYSASYTITKDTTFYAVWGHC